MPGTVRPEAPSPAAPSAGAPEPSAAALSAEPGAAEPGAAEPSAEPSAEPGASELSAAAPSAPEPSAPEPGAPEPGAPAPSAPAPRPMELDDESSIELQASAIIEVIEPEAIPPGDTEAASLVGRVISGRYRVHELIGQGGMGAVYRGEQVHLRKRIAIKVLRPSARRLPELVARFEREAIAGAHIQHPNVASAIDFGQIEDGSYFLVLEYIEGTPLKDVIAKGPLPAGRALRLGRQIASALEAVHAKGIVHRDIKPQNILVDAQEQVKVIDFGLAKLRLELLPTASRAGTRPGPALTTAGEVFGTLAYIAPEAVRGMEAVDARADLYALGVVLYELLAGRGPFEAKDAVALFRQKRLEDAPPMRVRAPEVSVPQGIEPIVTRLIQRDPALRYATATEVIAALDEALAEIERGPIQIALPAPLAPAVAPPAPLPGPRLLGRKPPAPTVPLWMFIGVALASLLLGSALVFLLRRSPAAETAPEPAPSPPPAVVEPPPVASAEAPPAEIDGLDVEDWRARLQKAVSIKDWVMGAKAFLALARLDPKLITSSELRGDVVSVVAGIGFEGSTEASDQTFEALTNQLGDGGLDILWDLVRARGSTRAGRRAAEILSRPDVMARTTPAFRVTFDLRRAPCTTKRALFDRAAEEGDRQTLVELQITRDARCSRTKDPCCFREDKAIADAIQKLKDRLGI